MAKGICAQGAATQGAETAASHQLVESLEHGADAAGHGAAAAHAGGGLNIDPMHQFHVKCLVPIEIGNIDASFTNSALWMLIAVCLAALIGLMATSRRSLIPSRLQSIAEMSYEFVASMVRDNVGQAGMRYFPFVFTLFAFVLFANMLGMVPGSFTPTSHIIVTFGMAIFIFLGVTLIGFMRHGFGYLGLFVPSGVPIFMLPLLVVIEIISYLTRPISLSVRLFANMLAGHTMLKVFAGFVVMMGIWGVFPLAFMVALTGLEILVAFLQAYVFAILTCIYLNDAINMHH